MFCWRKAPLWNQSSPIQPSTMGFMGTETLSAGCGLTSAINGRKPSYEMPRMPTLPLLSGVFFTSQSIVSYVSVAWSTGVGLSGPCSGPRVLVLDEALSNVDLPTEARILTRLAAMKDQCTIIYVSHRDHATIRADLVVELPR